jgi:hypothetical protein
MSDENALDHRTNNVMTGWPYSVSIKTQAILPVNTFLRGKLIFSIHGDQASLLDTTLLTGKSLCRRLSPGAEEIIELKSDQRLGEVICSNEASSSD